MDEKTAGILSSFSLEGKVALVTGATYGIGFAIATALAEAGAKIAFNDRRQERIKSATAEYAKRGIEAHGFVADVTSEEQVAGLIENIREVYGTTPDILVNNAGIIKRIPMLEMSAADYRQVVDIDLVGPFICAKAVIPGMIEKGHGKIINICSMMSELGRETIAGYAAAKGGLKMLTKNICSEFGEANIQCNGIGPGYIATPQTAPLRERQADGSRHPFDQFICAKTPAGRWGTPEDLMGPAVFLASDASNFVNGHILYVDGGILAYIGKQPESHSLALKNGWGQELNLEYTFEKLFGFGSGNGYPAERVVPEQRNKKILDSVREASFHPFTELLSKLDRDLVRGAFAGEHFQEYFFANATNEAVTKVVREVLA
jgi:gluconate 5-dehydrogenase